MELSEVLEDTRCWQQALCQERRSGTAEPGMPGLHGLPLRLSAFSWTSLRRRGHEPRALCVAYVSLATKQEVLVQKSTCLQSQCYLEVLASIR